METMKNKKPTRTLAHGDVFTYNGERGTFLRWIGAERSVAFRSANYRLASVHNGDGEVVVWNLNMAGSVAVLDNIAAV